MATRRRNRFSYIFNFDKKNKVVPVGGPIHSLDPVASVEYVVSNPSFDSNMPTAMRMSSKKVIARTKPVRPTRVLSAEIIGIRPRKTMMDWIFRRTRKSPALESQMLPQLLAKPRRGGKRKTVKKRNGNKKYLYYI